MDKIGIGSRVKWSSSSNGGTTEKTGEVVQVVPAMGNPDFRPFEKSHRRHNDGTALWRDHESYLVSVPAPAPSLAKPKLYWPRVSKLELAGE